MATIHHLPSAGKPPVLQTADQNAMTIMSGGDVVTIAPKVPRPEAALRLSEDDPKFDFSFFKETPFIEPEKRAPAPHVEASRAPVPVAMNVTGRLMNYSLLSPEEQAHVVRTVHSIDSLAQALDAFEDAIKAFEQTARVKGVGPGFSSVSFQEFIMEVNASYKGFHIDFGRMKRNFGALQEVLKKQK